MRPSMLFILKADSLERDDRVRKQALSLLKKGCDVRFLVNFNHNKVCHGYTSYGVKYESISIRTRDIFKSQAMILIKAFEFWMRVSSQIQEKDMLVIHEEATFMIGALTNKKFIWDLHEFPSKFNNLFGKIFLKLIEKKSYKILHANRERLNACFDKSLFNDKSKHWVINNYPDKEFFNRSNDLITDPRIVNWLQSDKFVYLQGLFIEGRFPYNTVKSILANIENLPVKVLIVGTFDDQSLQKLKEEFGSLFEKKVYLLGPIDQLEIPIYLSKCLFTIILYKSISINNFYCEPNRLYQSIALNIPVIVGNNPTSKSIVEHYDKAIVLDDDGSNLSALKKAVRDLVESTDYDNPTQEIALERPSKGDQHIWDDDYIYGVFS